MIKFSVLTALIVAIGSAGEPGTTSKKTQEDEDTEFIAYDSKKSIKSMLNEYKGDFGSDLFQSLLTRKDLSHLLYSDVNTIAAQLAREFPEAVSVNSIGQTWQQRDIQVITLDARKLLGGDSVEASVGPDASKQAGAPQAAPSGAAASTAAASTAQVTKKEKKEKSVDEMSEEELLEKNEDIQLQEKQAKEQLQSKFNDVPEETKQKAFENALGLDLELLQIESTVSIKNLLKSKGKKLGKINLAQLKDDFDPFGLKDVNVESLASTEEKDQLKEAAKNDTKAQAAVEVKSDSTEGEKKEETAAPAAAEAPNKEEAAVKKPAVAENKTASEGAAPAALEASPPQSLAHSRSDMDTGNSILITGATHARELLSAQVPLFMLLKLIHQGLVLKKERYEDMLKTTKFYFIPVVNVDGFNLVEEHWNSDHEILNKRKNMNPMNQGSCNDENSGVDLNRNYGVDWKPERFKNTTELCGDYWPGNEAFSEPESRAIRDFVSSHRSDIKFVINCHTSGNEFIWPYNGREPNDIDTRNPGYLAIFQDIKEHAHFPEGVMMGNSYEVIGDQMGGDCDDFIMSTYGIPSVTSEMGFFGQYIKDWRCQSKGVCFEILRENSRWIEYIFSNIGTIAEKLIIKY